ncbi:MAG: T9SS type A sorting domain-containing protein [Candidatus Eisenbacteria bacterium]
MLSRSLQLAGALLCLSTAAHASDCTGTSTGRVPLNDLGSGMYLGVQGGLYLGGLNSRPSSHEAAGIAIAQSLVPLDTLGLPDPVNGRVVLVSIGMSNATLEFRRFVLKSDSDISRLPSTRAIDCAVGGQAANVIDDPTVAYWDSVATRLRGHGSAPLQAQVVWIKEADAGPSGGFAASSESLAVHLASIMNIIKLKLPNVKLAYFTSRIYAGYATTTLNPEPYAYESGFAVRRVIERQLAGDPALNHDPNVGPVRAPWLSWGPYLWADGLTPRSDGLTWTCSEFQTDGTHPATAAQLKIADSLLVFFQRDVTTAPWYRGGGTVAVGPARTGQGATISASPNPTMGSNTFEVRVASGLAWQLEVIDATGRILHRAAGSGSGAMQRVLWDPSRMGSRVLSPGIYWARLRAGNEQVASRFVRLGSN